MRWKSPRVVIGAGLLAAVVALTTCTVPDTPTDPSLAAPSPSFNVVAGGEGGVTLCKFAEGNVAMTADFEVTATGGTVPGNGKFTLDAVHTYPDVVNECRQVWSPKGDGTASVTITELVRPGQYLWAIVVNGVWTYDPAPPSITFDVDPAEPVVVWFKNTEVPIEMAPGRMTGGGGQIILGDVRVTRGFTIHCDITLSNNVEINWPDNKWHLDKPLTSAVCEDDPNIDPEPPPAPFDTFHGEGIGRLNGVDGSFLRFTFIDSGEPGGKADYARIEIWAPGDDPQVAAPVLQVDQVLDHGNIQAHYDQPHK